MNVNLSFKNVQSYEKELSALEGEIEKAIDCLWENDEKYPWVKRPMQLSDQELEEMIMTALAAQDTCGLFVVVSSGNGYRGTKAIINAIGNKIGTAPEMEFIGDDISSAEFYRVLEKMRHYEVNVCVVSESGEELKTIATYEVIKSYMEKRYGEEISSKRIMIMTGAGDSTLRKMGEESGSGVFDLDMGYPGSYSVLNNASLFILAVAGVEIKRFISGSEVMATDSIWDIDGGYLAAFRKMMISEGKNLEVISYNQKNFEDFANWMRDLFMESRMNDKVGAFSVSYNISNDMEKLYEPLKNLESGYRIHVSSDILEGEMPFKSISPSLADYENIGEVNNALVKNMSDNWDIQIALPLSDAFNLGQLIYFILMTCSISMGLLKSTGHID